MDDTDLSESGSALELHGELTDAELAGIVGGELSDAVRFIISAIASPSPYNPKEPDYSGYGHMIGTCSK